MVDQETFPCQICGERKRITDLVSAELIHTPIIDIITKEHPTCSLQGYICHTDLNRLRKEYIREILEKEKNEYASLRETDKLTVKEGDHLQKISMSNLRES